MENDREAARGTILVAEDDPITRLLAVEMISEVGFDVLEAGSAVEAITILEKRSDVCLVYSDVGMPGTMDGIKLCHYIRNRWPPVLLLIASGKMIAAEGQLPSGAVFF